MLAPEENTDTAHRTESVEPPHEWVHFALGRRCAACGITLTKDDPEPPKACAGAPGHPTRKRRRSSDGVAPS